MTTTEPPLTPGEHVWIKAEVVLSIVGDPMLAPLRVSEEQPSTIRLAPDGYRWRRMPDDTAVEPQRVIPTATGPMWPHNTWTWTAPGTGGNAGTVLGAEPIAAGVPVGSLTTEPGPGAYLIGDEAQPAIAEALGAVIEYVCKVQGYVANVGNTTTNTDARMAYGGLTHIADSLRQLRDIARENPPRTEPDVATLEVTGEPLTLDAIRDVVREMFDTTPAEWDTVKAAMRDVLEERDGLRAELRRLADLANERGDELATHRAAQVRLMQHLGMEGTPDQVTDAAIQTLKLLRSEADNSQAGWDAEVRDIEKLEVERDKWEGNARRLASEVDELVRQRDEARNEFTAVRAERDEARRERDDLHRQLRGVGRLACELFALPDVPLVAEAQEPAQTPGGDD